VDAIGTDGNLSMGLATAGIPESIAASSNAFMLEFRQGS
jgi:hypothetical protein